MPASTRCAWTPTSPPPGRSGSASGSTARAPRSRATTGTPCWPACGLSTWTSTSGHTRTPPAGRPGPCPARSASPTSTRATSTRRASPRGCTPAPAPWPSSCRRWWPPPGPDADTSAVCSTPPATSRSAPSSWSTAPPTSWSTTAPAGADGCWPAGRSTARCSTRSSRRPKRSGRGPRSRSCAVRAAHRGGHGTDPPVDPPLHPTGRPGRPTAAGRPVEDRRRAGLPDLPRARARVRADHRAGPRRARHRPALPPYDTLERTWGPPLPHLFQRPAGGAHQVSAPASVRNWLKRTLERADLRDVDGPPIVPHDFRRLFATEVVNTGLPIHIAAAVLGHRALDTTPRLHRSIGSSDSKYSGLGQRPGCAHCCADHQRSDTTASEQDECRAGSTRPTTAARATGRRIPGIQSAVSAEEPQADTGRETQPSGSAVTCRVLRYPVRKDSR